MAFTSITEPRREDVIRYAKSVGSEVINIDGRSFKAPDKEFAWMAQLLWGQQLALELSKNLNANPDTIRGDKSPYREAKNLLTP